MRSKAIISSLLVLGHVSIMVWYYINMVTVPGFGTEETKAIASLMFYGISFMMIGGISFLTAINADFPPQIEICKFHSIFMMLLGTIYGLHYSGIYITTNMDKLIMICAGVLIVFIIMLVSAYRHGFFNKNTYD